MDPQDILPEFDQTTQSLLRQVAVFTPTQFNQVPEGGGWTAGQVAEHLLKAGGGLPQLFQGNVQETTRPADEKVTEIRDTFLDFSTKMQSPEFIRPGKGPYDIETVLNELETMMSHNRKAIEAGDLSKTCAEFEVPVWGALTKWEWIHFMMVHTQRHTRQLRNIHAHTAPDPTPQESTVQ